MVNFHENTLSKPPFTRDFVSLISGTMAFNWGNHVAEEELHLAVGWTQATLRSPGWGRANAQLQLQGGRQAAVRLKD